MKTHKIFIVTILSIFGFSLYAQQIQLTPTQALTEHKKAMENTSYIFEGKVIKQSSIKTAGITCFVLQITKIYKGSPMLKLGTIKVIVDQDEYTLDAGPFLSKGSTYVIFGKSDNLKIFDSILTDNPIRLTYFYDPIDIANGGAKWGNTQYKTLDELYAFFKENGLTVQEEK